MSKKLALCCSYNRNYITGSAPLGINFLDKSKKYLSISNSFTPLNI